MLQRYSSSSQHPLVRIRDEFNSMMQRFFQEPLLKNSFIPTTNITEEAQQYLIEIELPGMKAEDIHIEIYDHQLVIKGERKSRELKKDDQTHKIESRYGSFYRSFTIPENIERDQIRAEMKKGILSVYLPKTERKPSKRIEIMDHPDD